MNYPHDSVLTKRFVVKNTVERCDVFLVAVPQICDRVKSVALWSAKKKNIIKRPQRATVPQLGLSMYQVWSKSIEGC